MSTNTVYSRLLMRAADVAREAQYELDTRWLIKADVDEVAIIFKHEAELESFCRFATVAGIDHFNSVRRDRMVPRNIGIGGFDVRFEFLQIPGASFRIEAMCVIDGTAPLHEEIRNHGIVHASFKCADYAHYIHTISTLRHLLPERAEYSNSYGRFAYFGAFPAYFKPRINLRDRQKATNS